MSFVIESTKDDYVFKLESGETKVYYAKDYDYKEIPDYNLYYKVRGYKDGKLIVNSNKSGRSIARVIKPSNTTAQGIDVSYRQGDIDWEKVKNSGQVDFAIIRCGFGMNETKQDDSKWKYNSSECERLGIPYGVYLYSYADTVAKAKSEANHVIRLIKGKKLSYQIFYDMEEKTVLNSTNMTRTKAAQIAQAFFSTFEAA